MPTGKLRFGVISDKSRKEGHGPCWCKSFGFKAKNKCKGFKRERAANLLYNIQEDVDYARDDAI
jgi:hypothetical protein